MSDGQHGWHPAVPRPPDEGSGPASQPTPPRPLGGAAAPPTPHPDAVGMRSVLTRSRDQSRFQAPEEEPARQRRVFPLKALLLGSVGVLILGVLLGTVYVTYLRPRAFDPDVVGRSSASATDQVVTQTPQEIVTDYFQALSDGDIAKAMTMGPRGGQGSEMLLTAAVYAESLKAAPLTDFQLHTTDPEATEVEVSYRLGDTPVETSVELTRLISGDFQLRRTTMPVQISVPGGADLPLLVNGVEIRQDQAFEVVPGSYRLSTGAPFITFPASDTIVIAELGRDSTPHPFTANPELTEAGRRAFVDAASGSLDRCLAQKLLAPSHCPFGATSSSPVVESSIVRSLTNSPFTDARVTLDPTNLTKATMSVPITFDISYTFRDGAKQTPRSETVQARVNALMLGDEVSVSWVG